jgi:hypothetical protein
MQGNRQKGADMALAFVMLGIVAGALAAVLALATGAGLMVAFLAYAGGGMVGLAGSVFFALRPREGLMNALPQTE